MFQDMAWKDFQALQDSQDLLDPLDLRAQPALLMVPAPAPLEYPGILVPEGSPGTRGTKASEVILGTAPVSEGAPRGRSDFLEFQEVTAVLGSLVERGKLVILVPLVLEESKDLLVGPVREGSSAVKERRGRPSTPTSVWG